MIIGVPKEIKNHEYRVGLTPASVKELTRQGHKVLVEQNAALAIGFPDEDYEASGASILTTAEAVFEQAELIVKVKEPQASECKMLSKGQTLFTYLHLAPDPAQAKGLLESGATCIAYETVTGTLSPLPLLAPMSEVAGRMSIQAAAHSLEKAQGGEGVLLSGVAGVPPGTVLVIGGGVVGLNAARIAAGMGAEVIIFDKSLARLRYIDELYSGRIQTQYSTKANIESCLPKADVVIGAVLIPGAAAPKVVTRSDLKLMKAGAVIVDVSIDQGGCFETSKATTHQDPIYCIDGIVHYCVANMPGAVAKTATLALNNATLPFVEVLANKGVKAALTDDPHLLNGLNVHQNQITYKAVAESLGYPYVSANGILDSLP